MLHTVLRRRADGESVEDIRPDLIIPTGQAQRPQPEPGQHLPRPGRVRQAAGPPRSRRPGPTMISPPTKQAPDQHEPQQDHRWSAHIPPIFPEYYGDPVFQEAATVREGSGLQFCVVAKAGRT